MNTVDSTRILTRQEIATVIQELHRLRRSRNTRQNAIIFRLSACCGLRVSEIVGLSLSNLKLASDRPHIHVPATIAKRQRSRRVPLWWDALTLAALTELKRERTAEGATGADPFICVQAAGKFGKRMNVRNCQDRWRTAIRVLGSERTAELSIHAGRHSFCSHALAGGRSLPQVRDAAGHSSVGTTSIYLHAIDDGTIGNLFDFSPAAGIQNRIFIPVSAYG